MAGYTRQDTTGQLANGNPIDADIFNDEYDAIESAFNASTGHNHDGTTGGGAPIESIGPSQELEVTSNAVFPKVNNLIDLGKSGLRWKDGYFGTTVYTQDLTASRDGIFGRNLSVTGNVTINGNTTIGDAAADTVTVNADVASNLTPSVTGTYNLGTSTDEWNNLFLDGTANVDFLIVDEDADITGTLDVTGDVGIDGDFDINTTKVTIEAATGNTAIAGTLGVADVVSVTDLTSATSTTTGAVVVSGGVGIAENLHVGGTMDVTGDATLDNLDVTTLDASGAVGIDGNFDIGTNKFTVNATTGDTVVGGNLQVNGNTTLGDASTDTITFTGDIDSGLIPSITSSYSIGDLSNYWSHVYTDYITTSADVGVGGDVTITGNLTVQGTTTTVDSTTVTIADKNIVLASNATTAADATGGGITLNGANATITYDNLTDRWDLNKDLEVATVYGNLEGNVNGIVGGTTPAAVTGTTIVATTGFTGNLTGDVKAANGVTVFDSGTDGTDATFIGDVTGQVSDISNHLLDEDGMTSNSATKVPSQQSVKAYVDAAVAGDGSGSIAVDTAEVTTLDLSTAGTGTGWELKMVGTELHFTYNGTVKFKMLTNGDFEAEEDVKAAAF